MLAVNSYSMDFELSSLQSLSITDANQTGLDLSTDFTFEAWINLEALPSTPNIQFTIAGKNDAGDGQRTYFFTIQNTDVLRMGFEANINGTSLTLFESSSAIVVSGDVGNWVHLAVAVDISVPSATMYKNGSSVADTEVLINATTIANSTADFDIASLDNPASDFFDGLIDEVRVWSDIRTAAEIDDNNDCALTGTEDNLVAYWKLDNDILDSTSNNNDLTNNNSAVHSTSVPFTDDCAVRGRIF